MLSRFKTTIGNRGDTIIEVMVVLAVLGLAISISYATANRSLLNARQAQENSIATELAQGQVEGLASLGCTSGDPACDATNPANPSYQLFHQASAFCLDGSYNIVPASNAACTVESLYKITIKYTNTVTQPSTFEVLVTWPDVIEGTDTVTQNYTIPVAAPSPPPPPPPPVGGGGGGGGGGAPPPSSDPIVLATGPSTVIDKASWSEFSIPISVSGGTPGDTITLQASGGNSVYPAYTTKLTFDSDGNASGTATGRCENQWSRTEIWTLYIKPTPTSWKSTGIQVCP